MIVSVVVVTCIVLIFAWGFLKSFDFLGTTRESVTRPIAETEVSVDKNAQALKESITNYENAGIPYTDPANRYTLQFLNPFPNGDVAIIFYVKDNDGSIRKEAESRVSRAKQVVEISSVSYINSY